MSKETTTIETPDGQCRTAVFRPDGGGKGPWPAVIVFMDGIGIRPALDPIAQRIASEGYLVILPDMFYRVGPYTAPEPSKLFGDADFRSEWFKKIGAARDPKNTHKDIEACLAFLAKQPDVKGTKVGTTGYCMGGRIAFQAAGWFPERVVAAGSFHPSGLATDDPESPHLLAPKLRGRIYVAGADGDAGFDDAQKKRLDDALTEAKVDHEVLTYPAKHGWVLADTPVHDAAQTERHYQALFALFGSTLNATSEA